MAKMLITYHSRGGNTKKMAELIQAGAQALNGLEVDLKPITCVTANELNGYDAVVIGSPTYYGLPASEVKKLLDESVALHGQLEGKVGGAFASSANVGGGNETTILAILQALLIHGMVVPGVPAGDHYGPVAIGSPDRRASAQCREYGKRLATLTKRLHG
ncbi:MAG TPA: flavodoxin domain-containing protein [Planctomycetota bacterium]|nr:flavodoxin domain-containing protein [Planctomycetota bacterium]HRR82040.1 flavodoxin domain-containing protein [Planctomycetota bacterium]HRT94537.1 flavodoxin domain-containing protein [Planctomycetota bacterium]